MFRKLGGTLVLLLALPALGYQEKSKDKPATPEQQYQALLKEQNDAMSSFQKAYRQAKTQKEKAELIAKKSPRPEKAAPKFLALAEEHPKDPAALDALIWVATQTTGVGKDNSHTRALSLLLRDHIQSDKLGQVCQRLAMSVNPEEADLLRAILDKNPSKDVQAEACLALAQRLDRTALLLRLMEERPEMAMDYERILGGKEKVEELRKKGVATIDAESGRYFQDFGEKYAAKLKPERMAELCQHLGRSGGTGVQSLLRMLIEHDTRRDVQGVACLALGQSLKSMAERLPEAKAKDAEKLRRESEEMFNRAANKYADVKLPFRGTIGETAKSNLYELRHLSIGMTGPDIVGEDADSKSFKLSDYRGKVVLLDFWGHW